MSYILKVLAKTAVPSSRRQDKGWFYLESEPVSKTTGKNFYIYAYDKSTDEEIGSVEVGHSRNWKEHIVIIDVFVKPEFRRRGVGTALYDFAEKLTNKVAVPYSIDRNEPISRDAGAFWRKRRPKREYTDEDFGWES